MSNEWFFPEENTKTVTLLLHRQLLGPLSAYLLAGACQKYRIGPCRKLLNKIHEIFQAVYFFLRSKFSKRKSDLAPSQESSRLESILLA